MSTETWQTTFREKVPVILEIRLPVVTDSSFGLYQFSARFAILRNLLHGQSCEINQELSYWIGVLESALAEGAP